MVNGDEVVGGGDSGSCSCGGVSGWFNFFFFFQWWWSVAASYGCGFAKKVVVFRERKRDKEKETENKKTIFK